MVKKIKRIIKICSHCGRFIKDDDLFCSKELKSRLRLVKYDNGDWKI